MDAMSLGLNGARLKNASWVIGDNVKFLSTFIKHVEFQLVIYNYKQKNGHHRERFNAQATSLQSDHRTPGAGHRLWPTGVLAALVENGLARVLAGDGHPNGFSSNHPGVAFQQNRQQHVSSGPDVGMGDPESYRGPCGGARG
jgi:hypothetical protein